MVFGPGLIVMEADNDAGAVSTYMQAGGPSLPRLSRHLQPARRLVLLGAQTYPLDFGLWGPWVGCVDKDGVRIHPDASKGLPWIARFDPDAGQSIVLWEVVNSLVHDASFRDTQNRRRGKIATSVSAGMLKTSG